MLVIRMNRVGKHKSPIYRIVAMDSRNKTNGSIVAQIGTYNKNLKPKLNVNKELLDKYLGYGAQMSETIKNMFNKEKLLVKSAPAKITKKKVRKVSAKAKAKKAAKSTSKKEK